MFVYYPGKNASVCTQNSVPVCLGNALGKMFPFTSLVHSRILWKQHPFDLETFCPWRSGDSNKNYLYFSLLLCPDLTTKVSWNENPREIQKKFLNIITMVLFNLKLTLIPLYPTLVGCVRNHLGMFFLLLIIICFVSWQFVISIFILNIVDAFQQYWIMLSAKLFWNAIK